MHVVEGSALGQRAYFCAKPFCFLPKVFYFAQKDLTSRQKHLAAHPKSLLFEQKPFMFGQKSFPSSQIYVACALKNLPSRKKNFSFGRKHFPFAKYYWLDPKIKSSAVNYECHSESRSDEESLSMSVPAFPAAKIPHPPSSDSE